MECSVQIVPQGGRRPLVLARLPRAVATTPATRRQSFPSLDAPARVRRRDAKVCPASGSAGHRQGGTGSGFERVHRRSAVLLWRRESPRRKDVRCGRECLCTLAAVPNSHAGLRAELQSSGSGAVVGRDVGPVTTGFPRPTSPLPLRSCAAMPLSDGAWFLPSYTPPGGASRTAAVAPRLAEVVLARQAQARWQIAGRHRPAPRTAVCPRRPFGTL